MDWMDGFITSSWMPASLFVVLIQHKVQSTPICIRRALIRPGSTCHQFALVLGARRIHTHMHTHTYNITSIQLKRASENIDLNPSCGFVFLYHYCCCITIHSGRAHTHTQNTSTYRTHIYVLSRVSCQLRCMYEELRFYV